jgi:hypothetical protein
MLFVAVVTVDTSGFPEFELQSKNTKLQSQMQNLRVTDSTNSKVPGQSDWAYSQFQPRPQPPPISMPSGATETINAIKESQRAQVQITKDLASMIERAVTPGNSVAARPRAEHEPIGQG